MTPEQTQARRVGWICSKCAFGLGATWLDGHSATFHTNECGVCNKQRQVTNPENFIWY